MGLNHMYYPRFDGIDRLMERMHLAPPNLFARLKQLFGVVSIDPLAVLQPQPKNEAKNRAGLPDILLLGVPTHLQRTHRNSVQRSGISHRYRPARRVVAAAVQTEPARPR
jgi:hypothetical protein